MRTLAQIVERWRGVADAWEEQLREYPKGYIPVLKGVEPPPERHREDIRNWINWLRNMADEVEEAAKSRSSCVRFANCPECGKAVAVTRGGWTWRHTGLGGVRHRVHVGIQQGD